MNPLYHGDNDSKQHYEGLEKLTDRELQEKQSYLLWKIERSNERIKLNLQFWFYATLISAALFVFISTQK